MTDRLEEIERRWASSVWGCTGDVRRLIAEVKRRTEEAAEWHDRAVQYGNEVERLRLLVVGHHDCTSMAKLRNGLPCPVCSDQRSEAGEQQP